MIARSIIVEGSVQGVFYREWAVGKARELGIAGWVRNLRDGRVEVYAVGPEPVVARFIDYLNQGSPASRVDKLKSKNAPVESLNGFTRRSSE